MSTIIFYANMYINIFEAILGLVSTITLLIMYFRIIKPMQADLQYIKKEFYPFFAELVGKNGFKKKRKKRTLTKRKKRSKK